MNKKTLTYLIVLVVLIAVLAIVTHAHHTAEEPQPPVLENPVNSNEPAEELPVSPSPEIESTPTPTPTPTPEPTPYKPDIDISSWEYVLVNAQNNIGDYVPELTELEYKQKFDSRAVDALQAFIDAARAEGLSVYLSSSYRSYAEQEYLFNRKVAQYGGDTATAATIVAPPGTSEHQTGLCCDITDRYYEFKDSSLENTDLYKWMYEHCDEYGFILRYPKDKEDITGIIYEPWHFRYVGTEAAAFIMENGLCLEEFVALYTE